MDYHLSQVDYELYLDMEEQERISESGGPADSTYLTLYQQPRVITSRQMGTNMVVTNEKPPDSSPFMTSFIQLKDFSKNQDIFY